MEQQKRTRGRPPSGKPRIFCRLGAYLSPDLHERCLNYKARYGVSLQDIMTESLEAFLKTKGI